MLEAYLAGFTLFFIPLLSLSADVLEKFQSANQKFGRVRVYHLDELLPGYYPTYKEFLNLCYSAKRSIAAVTYVFLSPQFLVKHLDALRAVLHVANKRTLCLVVIDEVQAPFFLPWNQIDLILRKSGQPFLGPLYFKLGPF